MKIFSKEHMMKKITMALTAALSLSIVGSAFAVLSEDTGASVTFHGGERKVEMSDGSSLDFGTINLVAKKDVISDSFETAYVKSASLMDWYVSDATGTGKGYSVSLSASPLHTVDNGITLSSGLLSMEGSRTLSVDLAGSDTPDATHGPKLVNDGVSRVLDNGSVSLLQTDVGTSSLSYGKGRYVITEPTDGYKLTLPIKELRLNVDGTDTTFVSALDFSITLP